MQEWSVVSYFVWHNILDIYTWELLKISEPENEGGVEGVLVH